MPAVSDSEHYNYSILHDCTPQAASCKLQMLGNMGRRRLIDGLVCFVRSAEHSACFPVVALRRTYGTRLARYTHSSATSLCRMHHINVVIHNYLLLYFGLKISVHAPWIRQHSFLTTSPLYTHHTCTLILAPKHAEATRCTAVL